MFDNNDVMGYFVVKTMESLLFTDKVEEEFTQFKEIVNGDNLDFLAMFKELLDNYTDFIDHNMKRNILFITSYFRDKYQGEMRKKAFELSNEIITIINNSSEKGTNDFIADQLTYRFGATRREIYRAIDNKDIVLPYIKASMCDDTYILMSHSKVVSDEEFEQIIPTITDVESDYLGSINYMLDEFPSLALEDTFIRRVRKCAKIFEDNVKSYRGSFAPVDIKQAKRMIKVYKKASTRLS